MALTCFQDQVRSNTSYSGIVDISGDVTDARRTDTRTREDSALSQWTIGKLSDQLYVCKNLVKLFVYVSYKNLMIS